MGHDLKVGEIREPYLTEEEIWHHFNVIFSTKSSKSSSYKFGLIKALIENLYNVNEELTLSFDQVYYSFAKIYWNLVVHHDLRQMNTQNKRSSVESYLEKVVIDNRLPRDLKFDKLSAEMQVEIVKRVKQKGKQYVVGAVYGDSNGTFYEFDRSKEYIKFNPPVYRFMQKFQKVIIHLTNYHLACFLEKHNNVPNINYILGKVEDSSKRESLVKFYEILMRYDRNECFYCGKGLNNNRIRHVHVDHFIPWSFVQSDSLWNLVLACQKCNLSKSDRLAKESYLEQLIERNKVFLMKEDSKPYHEMGHYQHVKLEELYQFSVHNGYENIWTP